MPAIAAGISDEIRRQRRQIAEEVASYQFAKKPELTVRDEAVGGELKRVADTLYHLDHLTEAIAVSHPELFTEYIVWAQTIFASEGIAAEYLVTNLEYLRDVLEERLPPEMTAAVRRCVDAGIEKLRRQPAEPRSYLEPGNPYFQLARDYLNALLRCDRHEARRLILDALDGGAGIHDIYLEVVQKTQYEVGRLWQTRRINVAQEHYCTAAAQLIMSQLYPHIFSTKKVGLNLVAACVSDELHEIGMRMVADFFEIEGWNTYYLGANTPLPALTYMIETHAADVLCISTTMTYHLPQVTALIAAVRSAPVGKKVTILVGGYLFNIAPGLWRDVGADGWAPDAQQALTAVSRFVTRADQA